MDRFSMTAVESAPVASSEPQRAACVSFFTVTHLVIGSVSLAISLFAALALDPWLFNRPLWPGLDYQPGTPAMAATALKLLPLALINCIIAIALAAWLIAIGVRELNTKTSHWRQRITWALAKILHALFAASLTWQLVAAQRAAMPDPRAPDLVLILGIVGISFVFLLRTAWPFFLLIAAACRR